MFFFLHFFLQFFQQQNQIFNLWLWLFSKLQHLDSDLVTWVFSDRVKLLKLTINKCCCERRNTNLSKIQTGNSSQSIRHQQKGQRSVFFLSLC